MLVELCTELRDRGIRLGLAELHAEAREMLDRAGVIECIGPDMVFDVLEDAYQAFEVKAHNKFEKDLRGKGFDPGKLSGCGLNGRNGERRRDLNPRHADYDSAALTS